MIHIQRMAIAVTLLMAASCGAPSNGQPADVLPNQASTSQRDYYIHKLDHVDATELAETMNEFMSDAVSFSASFPGLGLEPANFVFQADPETQSVIFVAPEGSVAEIRAVLQALDRPAPTEER